MEFFATCAAGFESLLADELRTLRCTSVRPLKGQVAFEGPLKDAYRACLWSHLASRVVAVLARGAAADANELYDTVAAVAWEEQMARTASFVVGAHGTNAQLRNTQFVALRAKDAILDRMLERTGTRPQTSTTGANLQIELRISGNRAMVGIDLVGEPLFRRGYEATHGGKGALAPLRADFAAALLTAGGWPRMGQQDDACLQVPYSGMGSVAVEGACWALDRAPGLLRQHWGFEGWAAHDKACWSALTGEARSRAKDTGPLSLVLWDSRPGFERMARQALRAAGISLEPTFAAPNDPGSAAAGASATHTLLCADLSWVEDQALATKAATLAQLGQWTAALPQGTCATVLAKDGLCDLVLGEPAERRQVMVGNADATLCTYQTTARPQEQTVSLPGGEQTSVLVPASSQFVARLSKVWKQRRKWATREDVSCYRVYDADLPDYAVSIDLFEGSETPGSWLQIYEYAPPKGIDPTKAQARLLDVVSIAPRLLGVAPQDTFVRVRTKAKGGSQYADEGLRPTRQRQGRRRSSGPILPPGAHLVDEGGLTFEVNFSTRLDCGIFLDHRDTRAMLREMAKETKGSKRFLNLFAYTGTGSCYAADGGMRHTTTVDLSRPSLDWARRNMERNGFTGPEHEYVQADVIAWVSDQRRTKNRWDLVFCDVPTFSNSRRMRTSAFDVQRDHAELLIGVSRLLTRDGVCVFSCNLRSFKIDEAALAKAGVAVEDITAQTIPEDFRRNPRIHSCFLVRRTPRTA